MKFINSTILQPRPISVL